MDKDAARAYVVRELGSHRNRKEVVFDICKQLDLNWDEADAFVREVETFDSQSIARKQSPLLLLFGIAVIIGGLALTIEGVMFFWNWMFRDSTEQLIFTPYIYVMGGSMVTGLAMITGGIIGFRKYLSAAL